jgi:hypothetical protein
VQWAVEKIKLIVKINLIVLKGRQDKIPSKPPLAQGGVKLHRALNLNIFTRVTANSTSCCGFYNRVSLKRPQQFVGFTVILVKIFKVEALCNFTPACAKPPRLTVLIFIPQSNFQQ